MLTAALLSSYAAIDAAFWADVDSRVGAAATPRFRQYCAKFREAWAAEAAPDPAASAAHASRNFAQYCLNRGVAAAPTRLSTSAQKAASMAAYELRSAAVSILAAC